MNRYETHLLGHLPPTDSLRTAAIEHMREHRRAFEDGYAERMQLARRLPEMAEDGHVTMEVWQMDCDCASWTSYDTIPATPVHVVAFLDGLYENAEGPVRWRMVSPSSVPEPGDRPRSRDHALEAYEDGHPHVVHL